MRPSHWVFLVPALALAISMAGCRKPEKPKSAKRLYEEAVAKRSKEQLALIKFTTGLREILQWRQSQEVAPSEEQRQAMVKTLADKMTHVATEGLSPELLQAWERMLQSWKALASSPGAEASLRDSGALAARELNAQLEAHGIIDIRF